MVFGCAKGVMLQTRNYNAEPVDQLQRIEVFQFGILSSYFGSNIVFHYIITIILKWFSLPCRT